MLLDADLVDAVLAVYLYSISRGGRGAALVSGEWPGQVVPRVAMSFRRFAVQITLGVMRTFEPWVGSKYKTEGIHGRRVLILGESHYGKRGTENASSTQRIVRDLGQTNRHRFFTITQQLVDCIPVGKWIPNESRFEFWERVSFYNYVQKFVGEKSGIRPTREMWVASKAPFLSTLIEIEPQVVITLGKELQSWLPPIPESIRVCNVPHPSSRGFRCAAWQSNVQQAINESR